MIKAPTLADALIREWIKPEYRRLDTTQWLARTVASARKFVLDDSMSSMLADLAYASLLTTNDPYKATLLLDSMRVSATLPHAVTWIEYDFPTRARRAVHEYGATIVLDPEQMPDRSGWLCLQHPQLDTAFMAIEAQSHAWGGTDQSVRKATAQAHPLAYIWRSDDGPPPWPMFDDERMRTGRRFHAPAEFTAFNPKNVASWVTGISSYTNKNVGVMPSPHVSAEYLERYMSGNEYHILGEFASGLRYLWALLATLNDLPVSMTDVRPSKGYIARGKYRRYVDHTLVTLTIPAKRHKRIAQQAIALTRRRAHKVRGHWRDDWRHRPAKQCQHVWVSIDDGRHRQCTLCEGRSTRIHEHERGDALLGYVTHDYAVERGD